MKRREVVAILSQRVRKLEDEAEEAGGYGLYSDAATSSSQAQGLREALALLQPEVRWHYSQDPEQAENLGWRPARLGDLRVGREVTSRDHRGSAQIESYAVSGRSVTVWSVDEDSVLRRDFLERLLVQGL